MARKSRNNRHKSMDFDVVVSPKRKANKWTANIEHATLEGLKDYIRELYKPPALENDGAMLRSLVSKNSLKFTVLIETPSKPFNEWTFPKVCELYGLSDEPNPSIDVYPVFSCGSADLSSEQPKAVGKHLMAELKLRQDVTPLDRAYEATKTIYSYCYLAAGVSFYKDNFKLIPEKLVEGRNGQGNLDYAVECRPTGRILGVVEVKKEDFMKGFAQASVQIESTLSRKRKADEIDDGRSIDRVFGIVTDASEWYFMECMLDDEGKPSFKLSEPVTVVYKDENLQTKWRRFSVILFGCWRRRKSRWKLLKVIQTDATEVFQLKTSKQFPMMETFRNLIHDVLRGILSF
ncbi:hypothetical protein RhiirA1_444701 [Rhizophagus irregularis]|uniref:Crinkler family protein n=1 Tax=Rhizophagus irregularis TaxID=588596 RepID=A0A2N0RC50_9GLOM|nr:hypothetical protein RhiirA1_444701 [Rhizophagus irregularis]